MDTYTIGETAGLTGLPAKTIRFYEEEGVISPSARGENGYRYYSGDALEELKILKYARDLGLPLSEIKKLLKGCDNGNCAHSRDYISTSINSYLALLDERLTQMQLLKEKLSDLNGRLKHNTLPCNRGKYCCNLLHQLLAGENIKGGEIQNESH